MKGYLRRQGAAIGVAVGFGVSGLYLAHRGFLSIVVTILLTAYVIWALDREERRSKAAQREARKWKHAYEARGRYAANAEAGIVAAVERNHELELFIAGKRIERGVWMDGEWFPVDDDVQSEG